jgi:hypothetical protein
MAHVFISYSWQDQPLARRVARRARHAGLDVFIDQDRAEDLGPGRSLPASLAAGIRDASHILLVWTPAAAAAAAPGRWVGHELDLARDAIARGTILVPLLFHDPRVHPLVNETVGIPFDPPHRFEDAWATLLRGVFPASADRFDVQALQTDLAATVRETPRLRGLFRNPVDEAVAGMPGAQDDLLGREVDPQARAAALARAREAFDAWTPETVAVSGLPAMGEADWHALDFALWCEARRMLAIAPGRDLQPVEMGRYPSLFGRALGATGAGFDALRVLFGRYPGRVMEVMDEIMGAPAVPDEALPVVVDLLEDRLLAGVPRDWLPFEPAADVVARHGDRLTARHRRRLFDTIEATGNSPRPETPVHLLLALMADPDLRRSGLEKLTAWVSGGWFDGADVERGRESPVGAHRTVGVLAKHGWAAESEAMLDAITTRVRRLLRSGSDAQRVDAIRWVHQSDPLPETVRWRIRTAVEEGVYSSQFEGAAYGRALAPLVMQLARLREAGDRDDLDTMDAIRATLREHGMSPDIW